jgi:lysyl oxidase
VANRDLTIPVSAGVNAQLISAAVAQGQLITARKQGFCMVDTTPFLSNAGPATFLDCDTNQEISVGWEDQYPPQLPCQFVQIDNLASGTYVLEMHVNPELILPESDYTNNTGAVKFQFTAKQGNTGPSIQVIS